MTERLLNRTMGHEGFRGNPYLDSAGKRTIGYGWNTEAQELSEPHARMILWGQLLIAENECLRRWPDIMTNLSTERQEVLVEMVFQMGSAGVAKFRNMLSALRRGDYNEAARHGLDSKWAKQDSPRRAETLMGIMRAGR